MFVCYFRSSINRLGLFDHWLPVSAGFLCTEFPENAREKLKSFLDPEEIYSAASSLSNSKERHLKLTLFYPDHPLARKLLFYID